ncbi:MAG: hypothetical protein JWO43_614 [Candidatus Adlerbacteria bacterium]|nr:hypothetical protein [Candidatus Adlerbacteria bacterium]
MHARQEILPPEMFNLDGLMLSGAMHLDDPHLSHMVRTAEALQERSFVIQREIQDSRTSHRQGAHIRRVRRVQNHRRALEHKIRDWVSNTVLCAAFTSSRGMVRGWWDNRSVHHARDAEGNETVSVLSRFWGLWIFIFSPLRAASSTKLLTHDK